MRAALCIGAPCGELKVTFLSLDCEINISFCFVKTQFIEEPERYIKENSANCQSLYMGPIREPGGGFFLPCNLRDCNIWATFSWSQSISSVCKSGGNLELRLRNRADIVWLQVWVTQGL